MQNHLHVVGIQADLIWENPKENLKRFEHKLNNIQHDVDLVVLPEMFSTGFTMKPSNVAETMNGLSVNWMIKMAHKFNCAITGSLVISENNHFFNRLFFVHPSGEIDTYDKRHSFSLAGEDKVYTSGNKKVIINYNGWKICPLICYDLRFPVWARNVENYDLLIYMANWPVPRIKAWDTLLKARAIENMSYTIGVNRVGKDENNYEYSGNSLLVDFLGNQLASIEANKEGIVYAKFDKLVQDDMRNKLGFLQDRDTFNIEC